MVWGVPVCVFAASTAVRVVTYGVAQTKSTFTHYGALCMAPQRNCRYSWTQL